MQHPTPQVILVCSRDRAPLLESPSLRGSPSTPLPPLSCCFPAWGGQPSVFLVIFLFYAGDETSVCSVFDLFLCGRYSWIILISQKWELGTLIASQVESTPVQIEGLPSPPREAVCVGSNVLLGGRPCRPQGGACPLSSFSGAPGTHPDRRSPMGSTHPTPHTLCDPAAEGESCSSLALAGGGGGRPGGDRATVQVRSDSGGTEKRGVGEALSVSLRVRVCTRVHMCRGHTRTCTATRRG